MIDVDSLSGVVVALLLCNLVVAAVMPHIAQTRLYCRGRPECALILYHMIVLIRGVHWPFLGAKIRVAGVRAAAVIAS
jgi:hypothetical protein